MPYFYRFGRFLLLLWLCSLLFLFLFLALLFFFFGFFGLGRINTLKGSLFLLFFLNLLKSSRSLLFLSFFWKTVSRLDFTLDISETYQDCPNILNNLCL